MSLGKIQNHVTVSFIVMSPLCCYSCFKTNAVQPAMAELYTMIANLNDNMWKQ